MFSKRIGMRALTPCSGSSQCFLDQGRDRKEQPRGRASTPEGAAEPAGPVSCQLPAAQPRSSRDPGHQGSVHCLLPVPSSREKEVLKFIPTASRGREMTVCLSVFQTTDTVQHYPSMQSPPALEGRKHHTSAPKHVLLDSNPETYTWKHQRWGKVQQKPCPICCGPHWTRKCAVSASNTS